MVDAIDDRLRLGSAVETVGGLRPIAQAADAAVALAPQRHARDDRRQRRQPAGAGERLQRFLGELHLRAGASEIDGRRLSRHRDRLFERADGKIGVDRRGELGAQLEPFPLRCGESRQREGDGVGAGPQIDDPVAALVVGDRRPDSFDERGT